jgi:hypothetical protein
VTSRGLPGLVFRIPGVLRGGVTASTTLDGHGKTLNYHLLALELPVWELRPGRANMCATI